jgi:hypothetical protein
MVGQEIGLVDERVDPVQAVAHRPHQLEDRRDVRVGRGAEGRHQHVRLALPPCVKT